MSYFKFIGSNPGANSRLGKPGCEKAGKSGMVINDEIALMCWSVVGLEIDIAPYTDSDQHAVEKINFNFSQSASQPSVPNNISLPGDTA